MIALALAIVTLAQATAAPSADDAYSRHDYASARPLYRDAVTANPKDYRAWYRLAVIALAQRDSSEVMRDLAGFAAASSMPAAAYRNNALFAPFRGLPGYDRFVATLEQRQYPCRFDAAARAMDRWVGTWTVSNPNGPGGSSLVERVFEGCAIVEHWTGEFGERGMSLTTYDTSSKRWSQHYVSDKGLATDYTGRAAGASVIFIADGPTPNAQTRMTYLFINDDRVEQRFESSGDGGRHWGVTADLFYTRAPGHAP